ncbi:MAG: arsenate reductase (glutaredoxin) [Pseudomonadota bacterium]
MAKIAIYHNPRCSKSRETLALLEEQGVKPEIVLYMDNPLTEGELSLLLVKLGLRPSELVRRKEAVFKDLGLKDASEDAVLAAMVENPRLIERPIVVNDDKAALGRPPEAVLAIL